MASYNIINMILSLSLLSLLIHPTFSQTTCKSQKFTTKTTPFDNCDDLPFLGATLHWTYDKAQSTLSMAYTAPPPNPDGWVAWALNPTNLGMVGAQALIAYKPKPSGPVTVDTFNIKGYHELVKGPLSYNVTAISAEETSDGKVTVFATWQVPSGQDLNQVWQVGPVLGGNPGKHLFDKSNLSAMTKLKVAGGNAGKSTAAPAPASNKGVALVKSFGLALVGLVGYSLL